MTDIPVLIVGGGPVGLALACDLGWRGVPCLLLEQGDGRVLTPKMNEVNIRSMEFCRRWGITDQVERAGFPDSYKLDMVYCTSLAGHLLERDEYPAPRDRQSPPESPEKRTWCPQLVFDPVLTRAVSGRRNVRMRYRCRLDRFTQSSDLVRAQVMDLATEKPFEIRAAYMVACDGAGSSVRGALGIAQDGNPNLGYSINIFFHCPDFLRAHDKGEAERYLFVGPQGTWGNITVVNGADEWRLTVLGTTEKMDLDAFDARAMVRRALGRDDVAFDLIAVRPWRRSELTARSYRAGRVFLAGDAAHTMSPTGGFGMNTGLIDAVNLSWKLDAVLRGFGGAHLLDSYEIEQKPVARRNALASTHNYKLWVGLRQMCGAILDDTPEGEAVRREAGRRLKETLREEWECLGVQLGHRYEDSPICVPDGSAPPPDAITEYVPSARPGSRAPHAWLADGRSIIDLFGRGFVLLRLGPSPPAVDGLVAAACERGVPLAVVDIASSDIAALYAARLVLVRPDGHSAWRSDDAPSDPGRLIDIVRGAVAPSQRRAQPEGAFSNVL